MVTVALGIAPLGPVIVPEREGATVCARMGTAESKKTKKNHKAGETLEAFTATELAVPDSAKLGNIAECGMQVPNVEMPRPRNLEARVGKHQSQDLGSMKRPPGKYFAKTRKNGGLERPFLDEPLSPACSAIPKRIFAADEKLV
jgi:hypothetical protein